MITSSPTLRISRRPAEIDSHFRCCVAYDGAYSDGLSFSAAARLRLLQPWRHNMVKCVRALLVLVSLVVIPSVTYAQASIVGTVKDASGAVLPGVTVEASSPALIEKTRSVVTGGTGQYSIENLRPGTYTVTFTLTGFATAKREGIELTGSFIASVNGDMKVGAVSETVTVSGEAPVVDVK